MDGTNEDVTVGGAPYRVTWKVADGGYDMRGHRNQTFAFDADPIADKANLLQAMTMVANRLCAPRAARKVAETQDGPNMNYARFQCG